MDTKMDAKLINRALIVTGGQGGYNIGKEIVSVGIIAECVIEFDLLAVISSKSDISGDAVDDIIVLSTDKDTDGTGGDNEYANEMYNKSPSPAMIKAAVARKEYDMVIIPVTSSGGTGAGIAKDVANDIANDFNDIPVLVIGAVPELTPGFEDMGALGNAVRFASELTESVENPGNLIAGAMCKTNLENAKSVSEGYRNSNHAIAVNFIHTLVNIQKAAGYKYGSIDRADFYDRITLGGGCFGFIHGDINVVNEDTFIEMIDDSDCFILEAEKKIPNVLIAACVEPNNEKAIKKAAAHLGDFLGGGITCKVVFAEYTAGTVESASILVTGAAMPTDWVDRAFSILSHNARKIKRTENRTDTVDRMSKSGAFIKDLKPNRRRNRKSGTSSSNSSMINNSSETSQA